MDGGQIAAGSQFGWLLREIPHLGAKGSWAEAIAKAKPFLHALVPDGTAKSGELQID
jgi:hypothetical protein